MQTTVRDTHQRKPATERERSRGEMQRCPRCQLTIRKRYPQMALDYCPRCIALTRELVPLVSAGVNG